MSVIHPAPYNLPHPQRYPWQLHTHQMQASQPFVAQRGTHLDIGTTANIQAGISEQNMLSMQSVGMPNSPPKPSLGNVQALSQDLSNLKEQLRKLAQRGEELGSGRMRREELVVPQSSRSNQSVQTLSFRRRQASQEAHYQHRPTPMPPFQPYFAPTTETRLRPQTMASSFTQSPQPFRFEARQQRGKVVPIVNPNKREQQRILNANNDGGKVEAKQESPEVKELKQKIRLIEGELESAKKETEYVKAALSAEKNLHAETKQQLQFVKTEQEWSKMEIQKIRSELQRVKATPQNDQYLAIIHKLQTELDKHRSNPRHSFDDALKDQLTEIETLRAQLLDQADQIATLKEDLKQGSKHIDQLQSDAVLQSIKSATELKSREQKWQIQLSDRSNELQTAKRALETLDGKYRIALKEISDKDEFIMNFVVSRSRESDREEMRDLVELYRVRLGESRSVEEQMREQREIMRLKREVELLRSA